MKRFWKDADAVAVPDGHDIHLDGKPVRTPGRVPLTLPSPALAKAVADEWRNVGETIDPRAMPLTGLSNAAIDRIAPDTAAFAAGLAKYGESDLLCYRADHPLELQLRQQAAWDPLLDWVRTRYGINPVTTTGVMHRAQSPETVAKLADAVAALSPFQLAALSPLVTVTGSLIAALALLEGAATPEDIWSAANLDEDWQAEHWGEDDLARKARATRRADFDAGARFLSLL
ncbi:ATPase [Sphingomonas koreensis]|jgi:chaperone required for assembly of F1-ATPase|uniref:ATPase n=1 Tax=Sphingomonas koreensis TaxID=93064 RepID=A0A1L6JAY3_9SPHN|nr:ATP12 family protein [Sphingomonas koreensis]APR52650.1 ATPase [Sphingomonas koreensis]MDC7812518.1 ATPase [Sphingomonas koreensis]RSU18315.1 ATPase [Sphingomonas koreensis]RSU28527.1 ATPase [Sphingomonas koreensis]RSU31153.1 ATPase [Sphingomonas koreensis]